MDRYPGGAMIRLRPWVLVMWILGGPTAGAQPVEVDEVEKWVQYKRAEATALEEVAPPIDVAQTDVRRSEAFLRAGEDALRRLARVFRFDLGGESVWRHSQSVSMLSHLTDDGVGVVLSFGSDRPAPDSVFLHALPALAEVEDQVTPELFAEFAGSVYRIVFGSAPAGEVRFRYDGTGIGKRGSETVTWQAGAAGARVLPAGTASAMRRNRGGWLVSVSRGATPGAVDDLKRLLNERPVRIDPKSAIAIAWKTWNRVRTDTLPEEEFKIHGELRTVSGEDFVPWPGGGQFRLEKRVWKAASPEADAALPVVFEVRMGAGLFQGVALVDPWTGQVVWLEEYRHAW